MVELALDDDEPIEHASRSRLTTRDPARSPEDDDGSALLEPEHVAAPRAELVRRIDPPQTGRADPFHRADWSLSEGRSDAAGETARVSRVGEGELLELARERRGPENAVLLRGLL